MSNYGLGIENIDFNLMEKHMRNYHIEVLMIRHNIDEFKATKVYNYIHSKIKDITKLEDIESIINDNLDEIKKIIGEIK